MFLAAVGELMTEVAGEVADGVIIHGFTTERYVSEVTLPAIERGLREGRHARAPTSRSRARCSSSPARTRRSSRRRSRRVQQQIAFYGSTPAYRPVLELHGWGDLQPELNALSKQGEWVKMGELIDDDMLNTFAVVAEPEQIAPELHKRYGDVVDRMLVLRAVPHRPRPLAGRARGAQGGVAA